MKYKKFKAFMILGTLFSTMPAFADSIPDRGDVETSHYVHTKESDIDKEAPYSIPDRGDVETSHYVKKTSFEETKETKETNNTPQTIPDRGLF